MRLICGILKLDGSSAPAGALDAMVGALVPSELEPTTTRRSYGMLEIAVLDFKCEKACLVDQAGWVVAADTRLDIPSDNPEAVFARSLAEHGPDFPDHVDGDFAVALWNEGEKTLWLGRDFIGARPLAWTLRAERWFAFASLPKGLHGAGLASPMPDFVAQAVKLRQSFYRGSDSGFSEIAYLPAGHSLRFRVGESTPTIHRAYRPDVRAVGNWSGTREEAASTLRLLLDEAVQRRLPAKLPVGCHLSGGLDSSAITVLAARAARQRASRVIALSMTTSRPIGPAHLDERPLIEAILAQEPGVAHFAVHDSLHLPGQDEDSDWPGSVIGGHDDQMLSLAASAGADRILSGVGGDEGATYNGANLYAALLKKMQLRTLARELPARAHADGKSVLATIYARLFRPTLHGFPLLTRRAASSPMDEVSGILRFVKPPFRQEILNRSMAPILQANTSEERVRAFADHHVPSRCTYFSIMAARHGLAVTFPMLDRKVVDFMLSLPLHMFVWDGYSRQPFRHAMRGILPEKVRLAQVKVGLFDERFIRYAKMKKGLLASVEALRASPSGRAMIFDLDAIAAGLGLLPDVEKVDDQPLSGRDALPSGTPPWLPLMAVECLIAAYRTVFGQAPWLAGRDHHRGSAFAQGGDERVGKTPPFGDELRLD